MKKLLFVIALYALSENSQAQFSPATAPVASIETHWRVIQGDSVLDNYYWMYDYFGKGPDSTKAVDYLVAENKYLDTVMQSAKKMRTDLFNEMKSRIKEKDQSPPSYHHGYFYYSRSDDGAQYYKYCRKKGSMDAKEEILLDVDKMAEGHPYYAATGFDISTDNKLMAYGVDTVSRRQYVIFVKNLETGETLKEHIVNTQGDPCWANDNKTFFYTAKNPETLLSEKIKRHSLGSDVSADPVVYEEKDKSNYIGVSKSKNDEFIFIRSQATMSSEWRWIKANQPVDAFTVFQPRMKNILYSVVPSANEFLIRTNKDSATNFKIMKCPLGQTAAVNWKDIIPTSRDILIEDLEEFREYLVLSERKNGLVQFKVMHTDFKNAYDVDFGEAAYFATIGYNPDYDSKMLRYRFTSLTTPWTTYDYNMITKEKKLVKQQIVLGGYNPEDYHTERLYATARDGTRIPISLVYKKGFEKNGKAPLLLYGYGSYGFSMDTYFSSDRISLLNRGFAYAIAHVRGGQEMGRPWYENGKLMKKKNTFTDFIDCGEFLEKNNFTSPSHMYAMGGSAGGMLMGAITNMAPDLWHGVVAQVPFVDVVNTMLDESIPLTTNEFDEWGNPKEKDAYFYMKSYSPYENVTRKNYPALLVRTGLHDSQVQYFEPAKWVAKLRAMKTDKNVLLLNTDMDYGHGGASGRFDYLKETALEYAFLFTLENIQK